MEAHPLSRDGCLYSSPFPVKWSLCTNLVHAHHRSPRNCAVSQAPHNFFTRPHEKSLAPSVHPLCTAAIPLPFTLLHPLPFTLLMTPPHPSPTGLPAGRTQVAPGCEPGGGGQGEVPVDQRGVPGALQSGAPSALRPVRSCWRARGCWWPRGAGDARLRPWRHLRVFLWGPAGCWWCAAQGSNAGL